jgi:hypothetical protein
MGIISVEKRGKQWHKIDEGESPHETNGCKICIISKHELFDSHMGNK